MINVKTDIRVRYVETDAMGIVHHSQYAIWFEVARVNMMDQLGLPYKELEAKGYLLPLVSLGVRYHKPCVFDDRVVVETIIKEIPRVRMRIDYRVLRGDELMTIGHTDHVFMSREGRAIKPSEEFLAVLAENGLASLPC